MMEVRRLRLLRNLAQYGTIAATARASSLTPSAVSQQLSLLEQEVGSPLFIRVGRTLVLTEAARILVEHTERVLEALEEAGAAVAELSTGVRGVLRLSAFPTGARALVPGAIARCRREHPDLRVLLSELETAESIERLKNGEVDVALIYEYSLLPKVRSSGVAILPLLEEPLFAALPAGMVSGDGPLGLAELADLPWITAQRDDELRLTVERACGLAGFTPSLDFTSSDFTVIFALVEAGLGVSLVPRLALESMSTDFQVREVVDPRLSRTVSVAIRAGSKRNPAISAVVQALTSEAAARAS